MNPLDGFEFAAEQPLSPLEKLYFNGQMLSKYEPCTDAMQKVINSDGDDEDAWNAFDDCFSKFLDFSWCSNWDGTKYDIIFYGVSGYTGYLMMEYLKRTSLVRNPEKFTFAFAGRTLSKVQEMRDREFQGTEWPDIPILQASYDDVVSVIDLAKSAYVIVNVAGPYMLAQGEILIDACCHTGTHYLDVSGEIPWTLRTLPLHDHATRGNALICPSSAVAGGYPDMLTFLLAKKLREETGEELRRCIIYATGGGASAGASGGTLASRGAMGQASDDSRKKMADPFSLGGFMPSFDRNGVKEVAIQAGTGKVTLKQRKEDADSILSKVSQCPHTGVWRAPFTYAYFDTRICRRSNELFANLENRPYGHNFVFQEFALLPAEALVQAAAIKEAGGEVKAAAGPSVADEKAALEAQGKYYKQGEGPPLEELSDAWLGQFAWAETTGGHQARCSFIGNDGYYETARVAVETAMTFRFDYAEIPHKGGVLNCIVAGQHWLANRIIASGVKFKMGGWFEEKDCSPPGTHAKK